MGQLAALDRDRVMREDPAVALVVTELDGRPQAKEARIKCARSARVPADHSADKLPGALFV
jgi:hypothetical protein